MTTPKEDVYCTLLMSDSYLPGAAVLAHSLRDCGTTKKIACLVTLDSLLYNTINELKNIFDYVLPVEKIANPNVENLVRLDRLDLRFAFTKIALWQQEQFRRMVYIDSDVVALRAPDELFGLEESFAAAPDIGWPDCFNSGVMLLTPNFGDFCSLQTLAASGTSFDGADQGLLNEYFGHKPWHRLSFAYNCTPSSSYQYEPAFRHFRSSIKMAHFIGKSKPWNMGRHALSHSPSPVYRELLGTWWSTYDRHYKPSGALSATRQHVRHFVNDEQSSSGLSWAKSEARVDTTEAPMTAPDDQIEAIEHMDSQRVTADVPFQPPQTEWDATRAAPPPASKPEAAAFPSQRYEMTSDTHLFQAPQSYPEAPKGMYYSVPPRPKTPERPPQLFPWESSAKKPSRVFPAAPVEPQNQAVSSLENITAAIQGSRQEGSSGQSQDNDATATAILRSPVAQEAFDSFNRSNAWDNDTSIEAYVRAVRESQASRGKTQVLHQQGTSVLERELASADILPRRKKGDSLILTDFPTEVERPSLPVTPAPIGRPSFWGEERDEAGDLPSAEGVPEQKDWDPVERLEQLRRSSLITAAELPNVDDGPEQLSKREFPNSSISAGADPTPMSTSSSAAAEEK